MKIYKPSGIAMDIVRHENGVVDITNYFPPGTYNSVEEALKAKYAAMREMLDELKKEFPELDGEAGMVKQTEQSHGSNKHHLPPPKTKPAVNKIIPPPYQQVLPDFSVTSAAEGTYNATDFPSSMNPSLILTQGGGMEWSTIKAEPLSKGKSVIEIYRMAMDMVFYPEKQNVGNSQYIDSALYDKIQQVQYFFSHPWNAGVPETKGLDPGSAYLYQRMIAAIYGNNPDEQKEGMRILEERLKWYRKINWANILYLFTIPEENLKFFQSSVENIKNLSTLVPLIENSKEWSIFAENGLVSSGLKEASLSNYDARVWYLNKLSSIPEMLDKSASLEKRAMEAFGYRNIFKNTARELMSDKTAAAELYEERIPMTWDETVAKYKKQGYAGGNLWNEIIEASQRSNKQVNEALKIPPSVKVKYK